MMMNKHFNSADNLTLRCLAIVLLTLLWFNAKAAHETELSFHSYDNEELTYTRYATENDKTNAIALWLAPGFGFNPRHFQVAERLAKAGMEAWMVDIADSLFLPHNSDSMRKLDAKYVRDIINYAHKKTGKNIIIISQSYGAIPALKGIREWQLQRANINQQSKSFVAGAILFSPELYSGVPALGMPPVYEPIVSATNIPIMFYQAEKLNTRWHVTETISKLQDAGSEVYLKMQKGVTALFYHGDKSVTTKKRLTTVHREIISDYKLLQLTAVNKLPLPLKSRDGKVGRLDYKLKKYKGKAVPIPIDLKDSDNKRFVRDDYKGKVTVVNFWATWCPPCIKEIPSLNRLREAMKAEAFELISINYAENPEKIKTFLKRVNVEFPVLLDETGEVSSKWNVLVFPSTFVIGPDGKFKFGVNAAIEWDSPEVIQELKNLNK